jgi:hypothetical protein
MRSFGKTTLFPWLDEQRECVLSSCGRYRYVLTIRWARANQRTLTWVMLNPSTADAKKDDNTSRKVRMYAKTWGYGGMHIINLFALRATNPAELYRHESALTSIGRDNDEHIRRIATEAPDVTVAWGSNGTLHDRGRRVLWLLEDCGADIRSMQVNSDGTPRHPLYLPLDAGRKRYNVDSHP